MLQPVWSSFNALSSVAAAAFPAWQSPDADEDDQDERHYKMCNTWRMLNVLHNTSGRRFIAWMSFILEPIDRCLQSVQALRASSHGLLHMLLGISPLAGARQAYDAMLTAPLRAGLLSALFWYFDGVREGDVWDLEGFARGRILSICGQLWWRSWHAMGGLSVWLAWRTQFRHRLRRRCVSKLRRSSRLLLGCRLLA